MTELTPYHKDSKLVWQALRSFEVGPADFADYLVERVAKAQGCERTVTFDKTAAKAGMVIIK